MRALSGGSFIYAPALAFAGTDTFTFQAGDGLASSTLVVTATPPVAQAGVPCVAREGR